VALPIAELLGIPSKNVFCNSMAWHLDDKVQPVLKLACLQARAQVCESAVCETLAIQCLREDLPSRFCATCIKACILCNTHKSMPLKAFRGKLWSPEGIGLYKCPVGLLMPCGLDYKQHVKLASVLPTTASIGIHMHSSMAQHLNNKVRRYTDLRGTTPLRRTCEK